MTSDLEASITDSLRAIRYHPEFANEAEDQMKALVARAKESGNQVALMPELRSLANDAVLMQQKYFTGRLQFLVRLITYLENRPEPSLNVAEDGCGSGVDLHVVQSLLPGKVALTGIDNNTGALARAKARVPNAEFKIDFDGGTYDVIYGDFVSIDQNQIWDYASRGNRVYDSLRRPGVVLHNADMGRMGLYLRFFGQRFQKVMPPELLAEIPDAPNCHFCRFEKS